MAEQRPYRILLLTQARTASHLLERMLSKQPNVAYSSHMFVAARPLQEQMVRSGSLVEWPASEREALKDAWQEALPRYLGAFDEARKEGKIAFHRMHPHFSLYPELAAMYTFNEHYEKPDWSYWQPHSTTGSATESYTSPIVLPDDAILQWSDRVVFLIRHPGLMVPPIYRIMRLEAMSETTWGGPNQTIVEDKLRQNCCKKDAYWAQTEMRYNNARELQGKFDYHGARALSFAW